MIIWPYGCYSKSALTVKKKNHFFEKNRNVQNAIGSHLKFIMKYSQKKLLVYTIQTTS